MAIEKFLDLARQWAPFMRYTSKIAVALRCDDGEWDLRFAFSAVSFEEIVVVPVHIETRSLLVIREAAPIAAAEAVRTIEEMVASPASIVIAGQTLLLGGSAQPLSNYHALCLPRFPGPRRLPSITTSRTHDGTGLSQIDLLDIDLELRTCATPYDSLVELIGDIGLPLQPQDILYNARTEMTLAPPAEVKNFELRGGLLSFDVIASPQIERTEIAIGLKLFSSIVQQIDRVQFSGERRFDESGPSLTMSCSQPVGDVGLVQVFLSYRGESFGAWWVRDQALAFNKKNALHKVIDSNSVFISKFFDDRNSFEEHVNLLLTMMNLDCLFYGKIAELKDGPDILARSAQDHLYVVECTTGDINLRIPTKSPRDSDLMAPIVPR